MSDPDRSILDGALALYGTVRGRHARHLMEGIAARYGFSLELPWRDIPAEELPQVFATEQPICFDCYVAATFRREHPELVVDNRWKTS